MVLSSNKRTRKGPTSNGNLQKKHQPGFLLATKRKCMVGLLLSAIFLAALTFVRVSTRMLLSGPKASSSETWIHSTLQYYASDTTLSGTSVTTSSKSAPQDTNSQTNGVNHHEDSRKHLSYSMTRHTSYRMTFSQATPCILGKTTNKWGRHPQWREELLDGLQPLLNFTTAIQTNLNVLVMGDSVGIQFGQLLEEAVGAQESSRKIIHESWPGHDGVTISTTKGGGAIANYRITGMFLAEGEGKPLPNAEGGGWNRSHVQQLLSHPHIMATYDNNRASASPSFDVMIFRIPHGWLKFGEITEVGLHETMQMAHDLFGVRKVILIDIPHTNNVKSIQDLVDRQRTNLMLQNVAAAYPRQQEGVDEVVVLEFARWTDHLMEYNARVIGVIPSDQVVSNKSYVLDRLGCRKKFPLSIAQGCAEFAKAGDCGCRRNRIAEDGIHWCMESIGGRLVAGIACLSCCFHFGSQPKEASISANLRDCEQECNNQFMSLGPLYFDDGAVYG